MTIRKILVVSVLSAAIAVSLSGVRQWIYTARHAVRTTLPRITGLFEGKIVSAQKLNTPHFRAGRSLEAVEMSDWPADASPCLDANGNLTKKGCGPDNPRAHPAPMDDEFSAGAGLNAAKWTWLNQDGASASTFGNYLVIKARPVNRYVIQGITQPLPKPPYQFTAKCSEPVLPADGTVNAIGLGFYESATTKLAVLWLESPHEDVNMPSADAQKWVGNTFAGPITGLAQLPTTYIYLRIGSNGKALGFSVSTDGRSWTLLGSADVTGPFTAAPDKVGIFLLNYGRSVSVAYGCDYFRRTG
ncbi:MAG TPA: hypothetical protein VFZ08_16865 [Terriglobia bacterium]|nr:hypothetical protein [Terriglobia bacterium]